jgi:DHA2 family multidrug resistance protein
VLDKGQELEWLDSALIRWTGAIAITTLVAMIWRECTHSNPIIQLRLLKSRNFATSVVSNFTLGVVLNGSTILIPQFLQLQLGYSAEQAGLALSPAGFTLALLMPVAGILGSKFDPRKVIAIGFALTSASMFWMMRLTPDIDFRTVVWMRVFQVVGLPLIFIPISTLAYVGMRQDDNNQVSGISNFVRNFGGAVGVSFLVSYLSRHRQISRGDLVSNLHHGNVFFDRYLSALEQSAIMTGGSVSGAGHRALAQLQMIVDSQANVLAFINAFFVLGVVVALLVPLPFLMKRPSADEMASSPNGH